MAEVLSQSQIDMLLSSMRAGNDGPKETKADEKPEEQYKKYDFYSPKKFTNDKLKLLKSIYDTYCRMTSSRLSGVFRANCEMKVITVEEQRYHEFNNSMGDNDVMELLYLKLPDDSKNLPMMFHISQNLVVNIVDRMLGGEGDEQDLDAGYSYTDIELALYENIMQHYTATFKDAWKNYIKLDIGSKRIFESPSLFQDISLDETVVIVMLEMAFQNIKGYINFCMPGNLLMNIFSLIDKRRSSESMYDNVLPDSKDIIMDKIHQSALDVRVELGTAQLSFRDIYNLKVDDVIDFSKNKDSDVMVYVEQQPWFKGQLGVHNSNVAVKLHQRVTAEEDLTELLGADTSLEHNHLERV